MAHSPVGSSGDGTANRQLHAALSPYADDLVIATKVCAERRSNALVAVVIEVARTSRISPAQVGLAWLLAHYDDTLLIPGTSSIAHLDENLAAGDIVLDDTAMAALDRRSVEPV